MVTLFDKLETLRSCLREHLRERTCVALAFSGGVDSALLLDVAHEVLGKHLVACTVNSCVFPERELRFTQDFCAARGIEQILVDFDILALPGFAGNPPNRCYICKRALFEALRSAVSRRGDCMLIEGSNADDKAAYRPGMQALVELGVASPLKDAGLTKQEVRALAHKRNLPVWNKPSAACLASRIPYNTSVTHELLKRIDAAENWLRDRGLQQVRVRVHGDLARIECDEDGMERFSSRAFQQQSAEALKACGFSFVTLDVSGFVSGSMDTTR